MKNKLCITFMRLKINCDDTVLQIDDSLLLERPLAESHGECLARDVMYLRELRLEQMDMMLVDLRQITEVYLGAMRDKDSLTLSQVSQIFTSLFSKSIISYLIFLFAPL